MGKRGWPRKRFLWRKKPKYTSQTKVEKQPDQLGPQSFRKIGVNDYSILDSTSESYYNFTAVNPLYEEAQIPRIKKGTVPKLSVLCAKIVAQNASELNSGIVSTLTWPCIKLLWTHILACNNDCMSVFMTFAFVMLNVQSFRCHLPPREYNDTKLQRRQDYLNQCLIPHNKYHRIENLFSNIKIQDLVFYLNSLNFLNQVILDFSIRKVGSREDLLLLFKVKSLMGLNLSNNDLVDSSILDFLSLALNEGRLPHLKILKIVNCTNLKEEDIKKFLCSLKQMNLSMIICDKIQPEFHESLNTKGAQIPGTNWISNSDDWEHKRPLSKFSLALVYHYLTRINILPEAVQQKVILDIMIHDRNYGFDTAYYMLDYVLRNRINNVCQIPLNSSILTIDRDREVKPIITPEVPTKPTNAVFSAVKVKKRPIQKRTTIKKKKININDIF